MKRNSAGGAHVLLIATLALALLLASIALVPAKPNGGGLKPGIDFSGPHFNLLVHGVPKAGDKPVPDDQVTGRHSVFVPLETTGPISIYYKIEGTTWQVEDCDATGDGIIRITLPKELWEDTDGDGVLDTKIGNIKAYRVYVVGLAKPSDNFILLDPDATVTSPDASEGTPQTIFYELTDTPLTVERKKGRPEWRNATYLFEVTTWVWEDDSNGDGNWWKGEDWDGTLEDCDEGEVKVYEDVWVFNIPELEDYWWKMTNTGVRLMQVRFYPILNGNGS
jgi:hypothetical protein